MMVSFIVDMCSFSPNGLRLACVIQTEKRIIVRSCDDKLKVEHKFNFVHSPIDKIAWSPDSAFAACSCKKHATIEIFSVIIENWKCKISFGTLQQSGGIGLENFTWTLDARHILCTSTDFTFLSVWSIRSKCVQYLKDIARVERGHAFSPDGSLIAVVHASDQGKSFVAIYSCKTWTKEASFPIACRDFGGISWSPSYDADYIACWDSHLFSNLYIYDVNKGQLLKHYSPHGISSGFKSVGWAGTGQFLVCTTHRNEIHVLNGLTFGILMHELLEPTFVSGHFDIFYEQKENGTLGANKYHRLTKWPTVLENSRGTISTSSKIQIRSTSLLPNWTVLVKMNSTGNYAACNTHLYPQIIWIYNLFAAKVEAILIHQDPVLDFDWNPVTSKLAMICSQSSGLLYLWTPEKSYIHYKSNVILNDNSPVQIKWSPQGDLLTLRDIYKVNVLSNLQLF